jgi:arylsulfatase A-like enzyme
MADRPNIVFIIADDHRGTELGHLGSQASTPHLDALAARGVSFRQAHCQGGMHGAICVPSRSSVLTGRNIFASATDPTGIDFKGSHTIPETLTTFPQALREAGYRTHAVGKWHNDVASFRRSFQTGEALMFGGMSDHYHVPVQAWDAAAGDDAIAPEPPGGTRPSREDVDPSTSDLDHFSTNLFANAANRFLEDTREDDVPFLLYVAFTAPHDPRTPPRGWEVDPAMVALPPNLLPEHPFDNGDLRVRDELLAPFPRDPEVVRGHIADYYGMIAHLDDGVGRILAKIDRLGLTDDTVVIYTADHGLSVGQHGLIGKQNVYEHSQRIPLVMAGPGIPTGEVSDGLVWHGDTTATIRKAAGVGADPLAEGASLIDDAGGIDAPRTTHGGAYEQTQRTWREGNHKLLVYRPAVTEKRPGSTPGTRMAQLFDLAADPWEMLNLAGQPAYADLEAHLLAGLRTWQEQVDDPFRAAFAGDPVNELE